MAHWRTDSSRESRCELLVHYLTISCLDNLSIDAAHAVYDDINKSNQIVQRFLGRFQVRWR